MQAGGKEVTLNSTAQSIDEVELSKTEAGVTAKLSKDGYTITVFFDDYTAQITLTGTETKIFPLITRDQMSSLTN